MLSPEAVIALALQCAPSVEASTLVAVARAESGLNPYAIGVNGPERGARRSARSLEEAVATASALIAAGRNVDLGLGQINVRNLARLGLSVRAAFDPCRNLAAAAQVLAEGYARGVTRYGNGQAALQVALSYYNTGDASQGLANGYVARVLAAAGATASPSRPAVAALVPPSDGGDVFARARGRTAFVVSPERSLP
ncbi:lytic transglycosylase domain-containing protein [Phenylobacterium sp. J426]|uniref:lytic transglycosylase domain-containing protein n=1 Tax=Phenylobacterium sp. J426 TaxID=2898439 RepID=UPI0021510D67|nr:lytic transglycosylase domain-containing protein [Phenylobacterium sp. J426]MCR5876637.1 lytic transglycosylase domain-containing protein [Phenylobacterium sp. J426]